MTISRSTQLVTPELAHSSFAHVVHADGPNPNRATHLALYAWLVGRWVMDLTTILEDGTTHQGRGEIHAGWVLQGLAIQDVWMIPRVRDRLDGIEPLPGAGNWYGTTLRIYDPALDAWRILWSDPATNFFSQQIGRRLDMSPKTVSVHRDRMKKKMGVNGNGLLRLAVLWCFVYGER